MRRSGPEAGFTLIEVLIAISILTIATLSLMSMTTRMIRTVADDRTETIGSAAADARIASVREWPDYASLDSATAGTEANMPRAGWTRTTTIVRTGGAGQPQDFKKVTVTVAGPGLRRPVTRTLAVAAP